MRIPLAVDQRDYRWELLSNVLKVFEDRRSQKIISKYTSLASLPVLKIVLTSMFFSTTITHVISDLSNRELREFLGIGTIPDEDYVYSFLSKFDLSSFNSMVLSVLNSRTGKRARNTQVIVDCTAVSVDVNYFRRPVRQRDLSGKDYKWGYSTSGKFIGMKLTLVIEYPSLRPLAFLLHPANKHEATIYQEVLDELRRKKITRKGDTIIMDKGFYAYRNYLIGLNQYNVIPLIFPRNNFKLDRLNGLLSYPLSIYCSKSLDKEKQRIKRMKTKLINLLSNWKSFKSIRSLIEDIFKIGKSLGLKDLHRYTMKSVGKFAALNVLLVGAVVSMGLRKKKVLQRLSES